MELKRIDNNPFYLPTGEEVVPVEVLHYKMPVLGFRIKNFAYVTDAKTIAPVEKEKLKGLDVLVLNALRIREHISHLNLDEALAFELGEGRGLRRRIELQDRRRLVREPDVAVRVDRERLLARDAVRPGAERGAAVRPARRPARRWVSAARRSATRGGPRRAVPAPVVRR